MTLGDIQKKIYKLTKTNSTSYSNTDMLIDLNIAFNHVTTLIKESDGRWQWDDDNQPATDQGGGVGGQMVGTAALVSGQQDYSFPVTYLKLNRVEVKPNGGTFFYRLAPRDIDDPMWGSPILGIDTISTAAPIYYDVTGHSVFLYPIPNYNQAASLRFYFERGQIDFTASDLSTGTLVPGFASLFHDLLAYLVAFDYCVVNMSSLAAGYAAIIQKKEMKLQGYYAWRDHDDSPRMSVRPIRFK